MLENLLFNKNGILDNSFSFPHPQGGFMVKENKNKTSCCNVISREKIIGPFIFSQIAIHLGHSKRIHAKSQLK